MKNIFSLLFLFSVCFATAQEASVEKSTFGIQTGVIGMWAHHEARLSNKIALRTEVGLDGGFFMGSFYEGVGFVLAPVVTAEPRWYYNIAKRAKKSRNIAGNSANYLSLKTSYHPDWFVISNHDNLRIIDQISIIPTWGIKRNIGKHFTYEAGIGIGYRYIFAKKAGFVEDEKEGAVNLHLRLGYRF